MAAPELQVRAAEALDDLYRRHVGDVYRYTYAVLGNHADAEDVTQTTFINALRALERGEEPRDPSNWLLVIAHNIVRQRWRQAANRPTEVELDYDVAEASAEPDVELDELVRALQRIPPAQREALVMRELEGRSYSEISEMLGLTTSALETLLFRARRSLAEELENLVTCQSAELAISKQIDGRLSRKERRRLESHLAECPPCARLAETQKRQRKAFKGLAVLPIPIGLALFKEASAASAATLPTIGGGAAGAGVGATGVGAGGASAGAGGAATGAGGMAAGGSLLGGAIAKVAAVVVAGTVATGIGYEGIKAVTAETPQSPSPARSSGPASVPGPSQLSIPQKAATKRDEPPGVAGKAAVSGVTAGASGASIGAEASGPTGTFGSSPVVSEEESSPRSGDEKGSAGADKPKAPRHTPPQSRPEPPESRPEPPVATTPDTPAGPKTTPPATEDAPSSEGSSAPPATSEGTPSPSTSSGSGDSTVDGRTDCPAGGNGPGNGDGCGLARGLDRKPTDAPASGEPHANPGSAVDPGSTDSPGHSAAAPGLDGASPGASGDPGAPAGRAGK